MESAPKKGASGEVPPRVVEHIQSKVVKDGDAVTLTCKLTGRPTARIDVWDRLILELLAMLDWVSIPVNMKIIYRHRIIF